MMTTSISTSSATRRRCFHRRCRAGEGFVAHPSLGLMHHFRRTRRLELGTHLRSPGHQRWAEVIRGHQRPSEAIRGHQRSSEVISSTHLLRLGRVSPIEVIRGHQWSSAIISSTHLLRLGRASPIEVIRGHQWSSAIISSTHLLRLGRASPIERLEERVGCECMLPEGTCHVTRADLMRDAIRGHPEATSPARA
jgi:hypothetical protein